jgi:hypothetical protein
VPSKSLVESDFDVIIWQRDPHLEALPDNTTCSDESLLHAHHKNIATLESLST